MRIKKFSYEGKEIIKVYITNLESKDNITLSKIEEIKNEYNNNVVILVGGTLETIPQLRNMIIYQKEFGKT